MDQWSWHNLIRTEFSAGESKMRTSSVEMYHEHEKSYFGSAIKPEVKLIAKVSLITTVGKTVTIEGEAQLVHDILEKLK